jgi:hypothetical protein
MFDVGFIHQEALDVIPWEQSLSTTTTPQAPVFSSKEADDLLEKLTRWSIIKKFLP